jgi:hypothetical protein
MQGFKDFIENICIENFPGYQPHLHMLYSDYSNATLPDKLQQLLAQKKGEGRQPCSGMGSLHSKALGKFTVIFLTIIYTLPHITNPPVCKLRITPYKA